MSPWRTPHLILKGGVFHSLVEIWVYYLWLFFWGNTSIISGWKGKYQEPTMAKVARGEQEFFIHYVAWSKIYCAREPTSFAPWWPLFTLWTTKFRAGKGEGYHYLLFKREKMNIEWRMLRRNYNGSPPPVHQREWGIIWEVDRMKQTQELDNTIVSDRCCVCSTMKMLRLVLVSGGCSVSVHNSSMRTVSSIICLQMLHPYCTYVIS